jgi:hypothetical protein
MGVTAQKFSYFGTYLSYNENSVNFFPVESLVYKTGCPIKQRKTHDNQRIQLQPEGWVAF